MNSMRADGENGVIRSRPPVDNRKPIIRVRLMYFVYPCGHLSARDGPPTTKTNDLHAFSIERVTGSRFNGVLVSEHGNNEKPIRLVTNPD